MEVVVVVQACRRLCESLAPPNGISALASDHVPLTPSATRFAHTRSTHTVPIPKAYEKRSTSIRHPPYGHPSLHQLSSYCSLSWFTTTLWDTDYK